MDIKGYPISAVPGELFQVDVNPQLCDIDEGRDYSKDYPPMVGENIFRVQYGVEERICLVFKENRGEVLPPNQRWTVEAAKVPEEQ